MAVLLKSAGGRQDLVSAQCIYFGLAYTVCKFNFSLDFYFPTSRYVSRTLHYGDMLGIKLSSQN